MTCDLAVGPGGADLIEWAHLKECIDHLRAQGSNKILIDPWSGTDGSTQLCSYGKLSVLMANEQNLDKTYVKASDALNAAKWTWDNCYYSSEYVHGSYGSIANTGNLNVGIYVSLSTII